MPLLPHFLAPPFRDLPDPLDLTRETHLRRVTELAEAMRARAAAPADLDDLERDLLGHADRLPLALHLAVKLARSRRILETVSGPVHTSVCFAVHGEHERILDRAAHPHGEDFLRRKIEQLEWLFGPFPDLTWSLRIVDDGCPHGSGSIARELLRSRHPDAPAEVLFLADAIRDGHPATRGLGHVDESRKGGSIQLGMWEAAGERHDRDHVIVFTDADLSTHLGQTGLLLDGILRRDRLAAIGSRREPRSVVVKGARRDDRGRLFIFLWQRLLAPLRFLVDTQCGFKAFRAGIVRDILADTIEKQFAFDLELLLRTELRAPGRIEKVPIAWIDSEALSTTTTLEPYRSMLKQAAAMYRAYLPRSPEAEPFARLLDGLDEPSWRRLVDRVPPELTATAPADLATLSGIDAERLAALAR
jgi:hypothetical protein